MFWQFSWFNLEVSIHHNFMCQCHVGDSFCCLHELFYGHRPRGTGCNINYTVRQLSTKACRKSLLDPFHLIDSTQGQMTASAEDFFPFLPFLSHLVDDTGLEYFKKPRSGSLLIFWAQYVNCFYQALLKTTSKQNLPHKPILL